MNSRALTEALQRPVDREWGAKTSWYAWLYGAYPPKLGSIVKGPPSDGDIVIKTFFKNVPGLKGLINDVQAEWSGRNGLLRCIDGGFVRCGSINAALNYKIQSLGAIVMKLAAILLDQKARAEGLWFRFVGNIHDEFQMETKDSDGIRLGELAVSCITEAAKQLKFKETLLGSYKIGQNWSQTH
jgi:DNA polymerase I-like protein with 3'-5' exonuclease and polymerase domains